MGRLARVDGTAAPGWSTRVLSRFSVSRAGMLFARTIGWPVDRVLLRISGGRLRSTVTIPSGLLETTGARTGELRRHGVIYLVDGGDVVVAASLFGADRNPAWFHNLVAQPDVRFNGIPMRAEVIEEPSEQERLWPRLDNVLPAFATYRAWAADAGRTIPLVRLTPR